MAGWRGELYIMILTSILLSRDPALLRRPRLPEQDMPQIRARLHSTAQHSTAGQGKNRAASILLVCRGYYQIQGKQLVASQLVYQVWENGIRVRE